MEVQTWGMERSHIHLRKVWKKVKRNIWKGVILECVFLSIEEGDGRALCIWEPVNLCITEVTIIRNCFMSIIKCKITTSRSKSLYAYFNLFFCTWSEVKSLSLVRFFATPWTVAYWAPQSMGFSRQEYWSGLPFPSPEDLPDPGLEPGSPTE